MAAPRKEVPLFKSAFYKLPLNVQQWITEVLWVMPKEDIIGMILEDMGDDEAKNWLETYKELGAGD